ncbi:MAG: cysteine peptidase family C39 domain-containing protein [Candidatus Hydrogenedentes bacterium]|nr:cysteine peptidase family C39 domain-containing protein [Candidatus Hydrogenedentota bacterium]
MSMLAHHRLFFRFVSLFVIATFLPTSVQAWHFFPQAQQVLMAAEDGPVPLAADKLELLAANTDGAGAPLPLSEAKRKQLANGSTTPTLLAQGKGVVGNLTLGITPDENVPTLKTLSRDELRTATAGPRVVTENPYDAGLPSAAHIIAQLDDALQKRKDEEPVRIKLAQAGTESTVLSAGAEATTKLQEATALREDQGKHANAAMAFVHIMNDYDSNATAIKAADRGIVRMVLDIKAGQRTPEEIADFEQQLEVYQPTNVQGGYGVLTYYGRRAEDEYEHRGKLEIIQDYARKAVVRAEEIMQLDPHHHMQLGVVDYQYSSALLLDVHERDAAFERLKEIAETLPSSSMGKLAVNYVLANFEGGARNNRGMNTIYRANILEEAKGAFVAETFARDDVEPWLKGMLGYTIGSAHWSLGNYADAVAFYENTLPYMAEAGYMRAKLELAIAESKAELLKNDPEGALEAYNAFLLKFPDDRHTSKALVQMANIFMTSGDYAGAADLYAEVANRWPDLDEGKASTAALEYIFENLYESTPVAELLPQTEVDQQLAMRCGPEALARLLAGDGMDISVDELAELASTDATGTSMLGLVQAAEKKGATLTGVTANNVGELPLPYIAYVNNDHFVLVTEVTDVHVSIVDTAHGERQLARGEFAAMWNGMALVHGSGAARMEIAALKAARGGGSGGNPSGDDDPPCDPDEDCCDDDGGPPPPSNPPPPSSPPPPKGPLSAPTLAAPLCPTSGVPVSSPGVTPTINVFNTSLKLHERDLTLSVQGTLRMSFARQYINEKGWHRGEYQGTTKPWMNNVGDGWTHNLNTHIRTQIGTTPSYVTLYDSQGSARTYEYDSTLSGTDYYYRHAAGQSYEKSDVLKRDTTTLAYTLEKKSGLTYTFSAATTDTYRYARLESIEDHAGNANTLAYDGAVGTGKLTKVTSPTSDYTMDFSYSGALITKVELKKSTTVLNSMQYAYASDELTKVTDHASKDVLYSYDTLVVVDRRDEDYYGRFIDKITDKSGNDIDLAWSWSTVGTGEATKIEVTNVEGLKASYDRGAGNVVTIKEMDGTTQLSKYVNTPLSSTDLGRSKYHDYYKDTTNYERWEYQYDANNMMTKLVAPDASAYATLTYNSVGKVLTRQYGTGPVMTWYYDNGGSRLTRIANAFGIGNTWHYDANDRVTKITHPAVAAAGTLYAYDADGLVTRMTSPTGVYTDYEFDALGRQTKVIADVGGLAIVSTSYYDDMGNVTRATDPRGKDTYYYYGDVSCSGCGGGGQLTKVKDALNNETKWEFDADGLMTKSIDKAGIATSHEYDNMGAVTKTVFPSGGSVNATMAYNLLGQVTSNTGFGGNTTTSSYDHMGRLTTVTDPVGDIDYSYNSLGLLSTVTDSMNHTTTNEYDGAFKLTKATDAIGKVTVYAYDSYGRATKVGAGSTGSIAPTTYFFSNTTGMLTKVEYASSTYAANYYYDGEARLTKLTDWLDGTNGLRYAYDNVGRMTQLTDYDNSTLTYTYDDRGNMLTMNDYHSNSVAYTYNDIGQVSTLTAPGSKTWSYTYDAYSRLTKVDIPNGMHTEYGYDSDGNRTKIHYKDSATVKQGFDYAFNSGGNITKITHEDSAYWAYEYDGRERITKAERYDSTPTLLRRYTYTYDDGDNLLTKAIYDAIATTTDTTTFAYNNANEQTSMVNGGTTQTMAYDAWGQLTSKTQGAYSATYAYRYESKLYSVTSNFPGEGNVTYETGGDQKRRSRVAGLDETWYNWTMASEVISVEDAADGSSGALVRTYIGNNVAHVDGVVPASGVWKYNTRDHLKSTRGLWNQDKSSFAAFEYSPMGGLYNSTGSSSDVTRRYTGAGWDGSTGLYLAPYRQYNPASGRWNSRDPLGMVDGPNLYAYVRLNPVMFRDPLGLARELIGCNSRSRTFSTERATNRIRYRVTIFGLAEVNIAHAMWYKDRLYKTKHTKVTTVKCRYRERVECTGEYRYTTDRDVFVRTWTTTRWKVIDTRRTIAVVGPWQVCAVNPWTHVQVCEQTM